ncbi:unnamed protein product [Durusdinium trenchii]|uniref:PPM-type phosphatase domain-containing protein n=1 Tax=Durusdinium trenchii TaxID=1381693 RepID=A0ABP0J3M6_9DINO
MSTKEREVISKDNFNEEDKEKFFANLDDEVTERKLRQVWSNLSGLWFVHSKMSTWEEPYQERKLGLLPRSRESGESVLARHDIAAFCCKGCKDIDDFSPGQDNFSCARLAGGFRLHCIADGHGPGGHWVSDRVVRILPYFLSSRDCRSLLCKGEVESALNSAFERMEEDLESAAEQDDINLLVAGTTVVCILRQIHSPIVWVACVGDSRAIHLCGDGKVSFSTNDHKPSNPVERERVIRHGCEITVSAAENGEELEKICVEGERGRVPELGFTRSLGDLMYKRFGVIAEPEIFKLEKELDSSGHFILASDGVWEFLSSDDIAKIVQSKLAVGMPKEAIVREVAQVARAKWKEEDEYCDDISVIMVPTAQKTAAPPAPDDSCLGGLIYCSEEMRARIEKLFGP